MPRKQQELDQLEEFWIDIDENDPRAGIQFVSLVVDPAIEVKGMYFSKEELQSFEFKAIKEQMKIVGPAMIPNKKILRVDDQGKNFYVKFKPEVIAKLRDKFNKENNNKAINVDHTNKMANSYIQENWLVEDPVYDKSKLYGYTLAPGTWFIMVKIEDPKFWEECKEIGRYSFSIEGMLDMIPQSMEAINHINFPNLPKYVDELGDDEVLELIHEIIPYRVGFDFDNTLSTSKGQAMAKKEIESGNNVFVVTKRSPGLQSEDVYAVTDKLGIDRSNVHFTYWKFKYKLLNQLNMDIFYDDEQEEITKINKNTMVLGKIFK